MNEIIKLNWSKDLETLKYVFHIMDAPPHGKIFHDDNISDKFPEGCPCGLNYKQII
jgi:hypothetical protein